MNDLSTHVATAADYEDYVRLFAELQIDDPVPSRATFAAELAPHTTFLRRGGHNVAYAVAHRYGREAHLVQLVVEPESRGQGVGRRLLFTLGERLLAEGCEALRLNVKVGNDAAIRLYAAVGLEVRHRSAVLRMPWASVQRLPEPKGLEVRVPAAAEDESLEARHDLIPGQIDRWRERREGLLVAEEAGAAAGFARFTIVGAMPFRARSPRVARALLEAIRPSVPAAAHDVQLVIEGQDDLAVALRDKGARLLFEIFQMRGPVPRVS